MARELSRAGAKLILTARRAEILDSLAEETGGEAVRADLSDRADLDRLCERLGEVDVLVANAGVGDGGDIMDMQVAQIDEVIDVNLRAPIVMATCFAQSHSEVGRTGQIVMIGSLSGIVAIPNSRLYNATKFGLRGYSHALRLDLEEHNIGVTYVAPGFIRDVGIYADMGMEMPPFVRTKSAADVADAVVKAIEKNPAEIFVSPAELRASATLGGISPRLSAVFQRRMGTREMVERRDQG